jgi:hypothetical protein
MPQPAHLARHTDTKSSAHDPKGGAGVAVFVTVMSTARLTLAILLTVVSPPAGVASADRTLEELVGAIADARGHVAILASQATTAPLQTLTVPTDDEQGAFAAVLAANHVLDDMMRGPPAGLRRGTDTAVRTELNATHDALAAYARARAAGDRKAMRAAASEAVKALDRADALLDPEKSYRILH